MTFLELVQKAAEESGTIPSIGEPSAVTGQSGRLLRFVNWTKGAWDEIQISQRNWRWLRTEFSNTLTASQQEYTAANLGISERFSRWITRGPFGQNTLSLYLAADGQSTEGFLQYIEYDDFRRIYMVGSAATQEGKPNFWTITPANKISFSPIPDQAYTVRGEYMKAKQTLSANGDKPEMPEDYHMAIVWRALWRMSIFDENFEQAGMFARQYKIEYNKLCQDQLPKVRKTEPMA